MKSVPVGVKPPGRRRTGFRRFWVAVGKRCNLAVREKGRTQRHSDPERDGGHRDRGRCGHWQASCPAAARAHGARCGSGWLHRGEDQTSARAASPPVARERGLWAGVGPWPGARREVRRGGGLPSPHPARAPQLCAELSAEVGLPPSPQRPNERRRGCGAAPAPYPPAAPPHPRGHRTARPPSPGAVRASAVRPAAPRRSKWGGLHRVPGARSGRGAWALGSHLDGRRAAVIDQVDLAAGMRLQPWRVAEMPRERGEEAPPGQRGALRPPLPPSRLHKSGKLGSPAFLLPGDVEAIHQYIWKASGGTLRGDCSAPEVTPVNLVKSSRVPGAWREFRPLEEVGCRVWNPYCGLLCT